MIIVRGAPFLLPAGKRIGTAQLAGKKKHLFSKTKFSNVFISLISIQYRPLTVQISNCSKISCEVLLMQWTVDISKLHECIYNST